MSGIKEDGFLGNIKHSVNSFFYSLTTSDRYASFDSPYRNSSSNRPASSSNTTSNGYPISNNNSTVSLVDNTGSNRSSISNKPFQYRPGLRSQLQNNESGDLQLQDYINGQPPLPSVESIWDRFETFLDREYPELNDSLGGPVTAADLNEFENDLEVSLPSDVRDSFRVHDGQDRSSTGMIFGMILLELDDVQEQVTIWRKVCKRLEKQQYLREKKELEKQQGSPSSSSSANKLNFNELPKNRRPVDFVSKQKSVPEGAIQTVYAHPQWIPLARDYVGNNIAVDLAPGPNGRWGQIILFGRDFDTKYVIANSWTEFLLSVVEDYEDGHYLVDADNETIYYYENNRPVDYLRVLVHRAVAPLKKAELDKRQELIANSTALKNKENQRFELPKETLITPLGSKIDLSKTIPDDSSIHLDDDEDTTAGADETITTSKEEPVLEPVETPLEEVAEPVEEPVEEPVAEPEEVKTEESPVEKSEPSTTEEAQLATEDLTNEVEKVNSQLEDIQL